MNRRTLIYAAIVLLLGVGWLLLRSRPQPIEKRAPLFTEQPDDLGRIEVSSAAGAVAIEHEGSTWKMVQPVVDDVDPAFIDRFFREVLGAQIYLTPVAVAEASHPLYGVTAETGTRLRLYGPSGALLDDLYVGTSQNRYFSAVRREGANEVYRATEDLTKPITVDNQPWRNHQVLKLSPEDIAVIGVRYDRGQYTLTWDGKQWTCRDESNNGVAPFSVAKNNRALLKITSALTDMQTMLFEDNAWQQWAQQFANPALQVELTLQDGTRHTLALVPCDDDGRNFLVLMDDRRDRLTHETFDFVNRFTVSTEHFMSKSAEE